MNCTLCEETSQETRREDGSLRSHPPFGHPPQIRHWNYLVGTIYLSYLGRAGEGLLELETRFVFCPIAQFDDERAAGVLPRILRLPNISVRVRRRIVREAAPACVDRLLDRIQ